MYNNNNDDDDKDDDNDEYDNTILGNEDRASDRRAISGSDRRNAGRNAGVRRKNRMAGRR